MPLPKHITARIEKDAKQHSLIEPVINSCDITRQHLRTWAANDYSAGATTEAERAQVLVKALEEIANTTCSPKEYRVMFLRIKIKAAKALANYNKQP